MESTPLTDPPELPTLDPGIQFLATDADTRGVLHTLVADHLLREGGTAHWIDDGRHAQTRLLARIAPSRRILDRIQVARGFTAFQHLALIERLPDRVDPDTSLLVLPAVDARYRADDLRGDEGTEMLVQGIATLAGLARRNDVPVLVTRTRDDDRAAPIATAAHETIRCTQTPMGPRFVGEDFETLVYPQGDGTVQTTLTFWERVLQERTPLHDPSVTAGPASGEVTAGGAH